MKKSSNKMIKKFESLFFLIIFAICLCFGSHGVNAQNNSELTIYHFNDTNGVFKPFQYQFSNHQTADKPMGGIERLAYFRQEKLKKDPSSLLIVGSDILGPSLFSRHSEGAMMIDVLNQLKVTAWTPSNYDFMYGVQSLEKRMKKATFPIVSSNVFKKSTGEPFFKSSLIINHKGKKIGIVGISEIHLKDNVPKEVENILEFREPIAALKDLTSEMKSDTDIIIAIAQLKNADKIEVLLNTDVDLIIGSIGEFGDSVSTEVTAVNGKKIIQTPGFAMSMGEVRFSITKPHQIKYHKIFQNFLTASEYSFAKIRDFIQPITNIYKTYHKTFKNVVLASLNRDPDVRESRKIMSHLLRKSAGTEISLLSNRFFLRSGEFRDKITKARLYNVLYLSTKLTRVFLSGEQLRKVLIALQGHDNEYLVEGVVGNKVNGRLINNAEIYSIATGEAILSQLPVLKERLNIVEVYDKPINDHIYDYLLTQNKPAINFDQLLSFSPWKISSDIELGGQVTQVQVPEGGDFGDLRWKGDQNALNLGGEGIFSLVRYWGQNEFLSDFSLGFKQQRTGDEDLKETFDKIVIQTEYRRILWNRLFMPFVNANLESLFTNPDPQKPHFFLGRFKGGITHAFPLGIQVSESLEYRQQFLDSTDPGRLGVDLGIKWKYQWWLIKNQLTSSVYMPFDIKTGIITNIENKISFPIAKYFDIFLKFNTFNRSTTPNDWAFRVNAGLQITLERPLAF